MGNLLLQRAICAMVFAFLFAAGGKATKDEGGRMKDEVRKQRDYFVANTSSQIPRRGVLSPFDFAPLDVARDTVHDSPCGKEKAGIVDGHPLDTETTGTEIVNGDFELPLS